MRCSMKTWGSSGKLWAVGCLGALVGCTGDTPASDIPAPDVNSVTVFYPVEGQVYGRGLPGAFPSFVRRVRVDAYPTGTNLQPEVNDDGSFEFAILAISDDIIEIAGTADDEGNERGDPLYIRVPPTPLPTVDFVCCQARGTCQPIDDARDEAECPDPLTGVTQCTVDADCGIDEGEYLSLDGGQFQVEAPNERGLSRVVGQVEPNALVVLENRGLNGLGVPGPKSRSAQISSDTGAFFFDDVFARGDDEIVLQVRDLNGFRSPAVSSLVPDAPLEQVDVVGVFAWEPLTNGTRGPVSVHISPAGIDGRGICPNHPNGNDVCFSGGLTYDMVTITRAEMLVNQNLVSLSPVRSATTALRPDRIGAEGDVRSAAQDIMVVVDLSEAAQLKDGAGAPTRFEAVARFVEGLRRRDRVGLVTYGDTVAVEQPPVTFENRAQVVNTIRGLGTRDALPGADIFSAVRAAAQALRDIRTDSGRIVVISGVEPAGLRDVAVPAFEDALVAINEDLSRGFPTLTVDVVGLEIDDDAPNLDLVKDLSAFSEGRYYPSSVVGLAQTLTDARSFLSGSFILLYDMNIPAAVGKSGTIELEVEVQIGAERASASYRGPLRILNSSNN